MNIDVTQLTKAQAYYLMIQTIVPRPIAWVLSESEGAVLNLAPFSYFTGVTGDPPLLMLSIGHKRDGSKKDTWRNIEQRDAFVVHMASSTQAASVSASAAELPPETSEVILGEHDTTAMEGSRLPRLADAPIALACRRHRIVELGNGPQGVIFGELVAAWIDPNIAQMDEGRLRVDITKLDPLARLGGDDYGRLTQPFTVPRPR